MGKGGKGAVCWVQFMMQDHFFTLMFVEIIRNTGLYEYIVLKEDRFPDSVEISGNLLHMTPFTVHLYKQRIPFPVWFN